MLLNGGIGLHHIKQLCVFENVDIGAISILKVKDEGGYDAFLMTLNVVNVRD